MGRTDRCAGALFPFCGLSSSSKELDSERAIACGFPWTCGRFCDWRHRHRRLTNRSALGRGGTRGGPAAREACVQDYPPSEPPPHDAAAARGRDEYVRVRAVGVSF